MNNNDGEDLAKNRVRHLSAARRAAKILNVDPAAVREIAFPNGSPTWGFPYRGVFVRVLGLKLHERPNDLKYSYAIGLLIGTGRDETLVPDSRHWSLRKIDHVIERNINDHRRGLTPWLLEDHTLGTLSPRQRILAFGAFRAMIEANSP